jgi:hypothetical protein
MVGAFVPPRGAKRVIVGGEAASGAKAHMARVQARDQAETTRRWGLGLAIARTWTPVEEQALQNLVTPLPPK